MADYLEIFNSKLIELFEELKKSFPDISEIGLYLTFMKTTLIVSKGAAQTIFDKSVAKPYKTYIQNEDESFLLEKDYTSELKDSSVNLGLIDTLKNVWKNLSKDNKRVLWQYFKVLVALNSKITE